MGIGILFPLKNKKANKNERNWAITVAQAAPATPILNPKIKTVSRIIFVIAPMITVNIPIVAKPWQVIKKFKPIAIIAKKLPNV